MIYVCQLKALACCSPPHGPCPASDHPFQGCLTTQGFHANFRFRWNHGLSKLTSQRSYLMKQGTLALDINCRPMKSWQRRVLQDVFGAGMAWSGMVWYVSMLFQWNNHTQLEHFCKARYLSLTKALPFCYKNPGVPARWQVPLGNLKVLEHCKGKVRKVYETFMLSSSHLMSLCNPKAALHVLLLCTPNQPANLDVELDHLQKV